MSHDSIPRFAPKQCFYSKSACRILRRVYKIRLLMMTTVWWVR
ncbi:hypothetical protein COOONC_03330 [Cooperia oncophora]